MRTDERVVQRWRRACARVATVGSTYLSAFLRHRRQVVLLVLLPLFTVEGFGTAMATFPTLPGSESTPAASGRMFGALFSTAFLTGLFGLDQSLTSSAADQRLVRCGLSLPELLASRVSTVLVVSGCIATYSYAILLVRVSPATVVTPLVFLYLGGLIYASIGILIGAFSPGFFEGSLLVLFIADMDAFLGSGLAAAGASNGFFPLYYPNQLFRSAIIDGTYDLEALVFACAYLSILVVGSSAVFRYTHVRSGAYR